MDIVEAMARLHTVHYWPGWEFDIIPAGMGGTELDIVVTFDAPNTNRDLALKGYPQMIRPARNVLMRVDDITSETQLFRRFFDDVIMAAHEHEGREAFRVGPDMRAPFHPHRVEGMQAYGDPQSEIDLQRADDVYRSEMERLFGSAARF